MTKERNSENLARELKNTNEELRIIESRLIQAGKMSALGQLSAGIAHELKQPLTGIIGFVEDALEEIEEDNPIIESLKIIKREAERMRDILNGIRKFSRASSEKMGNANINAIINDSLLLIMKQLENDNITVKTSLGKKLLKVYVNASQMQQVFVNMISNAKDAMESKGGGTLTVTTVLSKDGKYVKICFKDTGCGMSKNVLNRLSEPFFTTKGSDRGTGLGTSISFSIIKQHKGTIDITSKVGFGTAVKIAVPVSQ